MEDCRDRQPLSLGGTIYTEAMTDQMKEKASQPDSLAAASSHGDSKSKKPRARAGRRYEVGPCYWRSHRGVEYFFRAPTVSDGAEMWRLARESGVLEVNTAYSYLLLGQHFADTCVVAERDGKPVGFVSAFISPAAHDTVFVWQVAVDHEDRGQGVAQKLLHHLLARPACRRVRRLEATVTPSNSPSRALFESVARDLDVPFAVFSGFGEELFPGEGHEKEELVRIGPLPRAARGRAMPRTKTKTPKEKSDERFQAVAGEAL